jgi:undecaprenyl-diphosphatase
MPQQPDIPTVPVLHLLILALVQGLTEFLPISSSGHLVLTWQAFDALGRGAGATSAADRLVLDIAVHVGTLGAVCGYFRRDIAEMIAGLLRWLRGHRDTGAQLAINVIVATLPVIVAGMAVKDRIGVLRDGTVIAATTIGFGLLLGAADRMTMMMRRLDQMRAPDALVIGFMQILALIPGTSRAGITMTGARFLGYERTEAARFAMLLSIPAILGAGLVAAMDLQARGAVDLGLDALIAAAFAFVSAWLAIALLMRWLRVASFTPFVVYRVVLGLGILAVIYL